MPRRGKRVRLDTGVYRDAAGIAIVAKVRDVRREVRVPHDTARAEWLKKRADLLAELVADDPRAAPSGTLHRDIVRYLALVKHLAGWGEQAAHLRAWLPTLGDRQRRSITRADVLTVRGAWIADDIAPKTANNRVSALRALYRTLDGDDRATPCDRVKPLPVHRTPAVAVDPRIIVAVETRLEEHERRGWLRDRKTRARFRVLASTGVRPSELMRAEPRDVDLERRVWTVRDGKGGYRPGLYLTDDMVDAWRLFVGALAWGPFNTGSFAKRLREAGWPADIRPYQLRHSVGIALSEAGVDLADVQQVMGHKHQATTRRHYVPVLESRMQRAMQTLAGRLTWGVSVPPARATRTGGTWPKVAKTEHKRPKRAGPSIEAKPRKRSA